jgi:hypothetical protein
LRTPSNSPITRQPEVERTWELSEDAAGFLRPQGDNSGDITQVFTDDGVLLTRSAADQTTGFADSHAPTAAGGRLGRLLRYYVGNAGRHVVLHDKGGTRWTGRITGTRWHGKSAGRSWSFRARPQPGMHHEEKEPDHPIDV